MTGLNNDTRETIVIAFERRELIALERLGDDLALLAASEVLSDTFKLARELGTFTATTVAEQLRITAPNANNRLKRLVAARALVRRCGVAERGGKEFTYSVPEMACTREEAVRGPAQTRHSRSTEPTRDGSFVDVRTSEPDA
ncbi:hypothetical protein [Micromonospora gifhornensis]|uniref:hypothetical protein n=1 Tax=Micromonospora gifhornensis TaxID=84594 RepID=UPI0019539107|nr:hypothetical protein [Micromonospora gifhornensis]